MTVIPDTMGVNARDKARLAVIIASLGRFYTYHMAGVLAERDALAALLVGYSRRPPTAIRSRTRTYPFLLSLVAHVAVRRQLVAMQQWTHGSFDRWVSSQLGRKDCRADVFHGFSLFSLASLSTARRLGMRTVIERAGVHILDQREVLEAEYARHGVALGSSAGAYYASAGRMMAEYEEAEYILTCSEFARRSFLARGHDPARVVSLILGSNYTPLGVLPEPPRGFVLLCIGGEFFRKGVPYLLEAWANLDLPGAELRLLTSIPEDLPPRLKALLSRPNVHLLPPMNQEILAREYRAASAFCLPSVEDGLGLVVLEAMAMGVPVIVSENAGAAEVVRRGRDGYVFPARDVRTLAECILMLYEDRSKLRYMAHNALARAHEYSWERYGTALMNFYQSILTHPRSDRPRD